MSHPRPGKLALLLACVPLLSGCRQDMASQPRYDTFERSPFFRDNSSARPLPEGTVARGQLRADSHLFEGRSGESGEQPRAVAVLGAFLAGSPLAAASVTFAPDQVDTFPFSVTERVLERGRQRFDIYCALCHGTTGEADGKIVERGYVRPPSYHIDRLRNAPAGYFFDVMTNGYGAMPDYASEVPVHDRWAIAAYIRVLQLSQNVPLDQLSPQERAKLPARKGAK